MIERIAHAKINLALHVTGQREDGYHLLDSLVVFLDKGDLVRVDKPHHSHGPIAVITDGPFSEGLSSGPENLVTAAALALRSAIMVQGNAPEPVVIYLEKNLPVASGIGGGSADAAATLLALQEYWQSECDLEKIGLSLGADVPMCLQSSPLRARGIGDEVQSLRTDEALHIVLVNPGRSVPTPDVFKQLTSHDNDPIDIASGNQFPVLSELQSLRNDLQEPATKIEPTITQVLAELEKTGADLVRMSGSGATCFGVYKSHDAANVACESILKSHSDWWCVAGETTLN